MSDLIERQRAIDAVTDELDMIDHVPQWVFDRLERRLKNLPSAQPEIIVCEDCKWRISEKQKTTSLWLPCRALVTPDEFSCIYAERREVTT